jgi:hypothetical protein
MISGLDPLGSKLRSKNVPVVMLLLDRVMKNSEARGWMCGRRMPQGPMVPRLMLRSELKRRGKVRGSACGCVSWGGYGMYGWGRTALMLPCWPPGGEKPFCLKSHTVALIRSSPSRSLVPEASVRSLRKRWIWLGMVMSWPSRSVLSVGLLASGVGAA